MNSGPQTQQSPRPWRRNPWPALLAGAAIVVMAGNVACTPVVTDKQENLSLGVPLYYDLEWTDLDPADSTWGSYIR